MISSPEIRAYMLSDRASLLETINSICAEGRWMETARYEPTPAWEHALDTPDCTCHLLLVVDDGERIVGWCRAFPDAERPEQASIAIGLLPKYREQGWGIRILQQLIEWTSNQHFTRLYLTTRASNTRAIHLFSKFGFAWTRSLNENWIEMECLLG